MRLDHLLSKEHHENASPLGRGEAVRNPHAVVAAGLVHNRRFPGGVGFGRPGMGSPDTLLGFEATHLLSWILSGFKWCGVAPSWWWGVVFDLWIVVASI